MSFSHTSSGFFQLFVVFFVFEFKHGNHRKSTPRQRRKELTNATQVILLFQTGEKYSLK